MTEDTNDLIQRSLDAGLGSEEVKLWGHGAADREDSEAHLVDKLFHLTARMDAFERGLADNNAATKRIEENTKVMIEVFDSWRKAMQVLEWIGKAARPVSYIVTAVGTVFALFYAIKGGTKP